MQPASRNHTANTCTMAVNTQAISPSVEKADKKVPCHSIQVGIMFDSVALGHRRNLWPIGSNKQHIELPSKAAIILDGVELVATLCRRCTWLPSSGNDGNHQSHILQGSVTMLVARKGSPETAHHGPSFDPCSLIQMCHVKFPRRESMTEGAVGSS